MTIHTQRYSIGDLIAQINVRCEWLDMVRMQHNRLSQTFSSAYAAFLACVVVAIKNGFAPNSIFKFSACDVVGAGLVHMISKSRLTRFSALFASRWMKLLIATLRTGFPKPSAFAVLWHWQIAYGAGRGNRQTGITQLVKHVYRCIFYPAHFAQVACLTPVGSRGAMAWNA